MKQSNLPFKTRKEAPKDEVSLNARLLIQAGFIHKEMAGVYSLLPYGVQVCEKVKGIIRDEMMKLGASELSMSALQEKSLWEKTDRWDDEKVDIWFKTALKNGTDLGLAFTHEEPITAMLKDHISSYKDLPFSLFQFQTKFRNELRAKSGIMRGREFLMKDLYSFSSSQEEHNDFFSNVKQVYINIFKRIGIGELTYPVHASGGTFSKFSLEFQTITDAGEDTIYLDRSLKVGINDEIMSDDICTELGMDKERLEKVKTAEVGNIFNLGTKFSEALGLNYKDEAGDRFPVVMGSYGIGIGRVMGVVAEVLSDEKGLVWPKSIAPFDVHIIVLPDSEGRTYAEAYKIYEKLSLQSSIISGIEVLLDDRDLGAGAKLADADLIGIPTRIVIGTKSLADGKVEVVDRKTNNTSMVELSEVVSYIRAQK